MKILLVGAGQLGSRHLQGILKSENKTAVFVLDPSSESLMIAKQRAEEISDFKGITYLSNWSELPKEFDLAIVSTNANIREAVTKRLLESHRIKFLILEKILFQEAIAFERMSTLIKQHSVPTWVNHPRRMFDEYKHIKEEYRQLGETCTVSVAGGNWGLGCNGLHFLDLIMFITGQEIEKLDAHWVNDELQNSKRLDFIEFTGTLKGKAVDGSPFTITSFPTDATPVTISICTSSARWIIQEGPVSKTARILKSNQFNVELRTFHMKYQSSLTTILIDQIWNTGVCDLPSYEEAAKIHKLFIVTLLEKYNSIVGKNANKCPIT